MNNEQWMLVEDGEPVALHTLEPGRLFRHGETIALRTAHTGFTCLHDAYIVGTGTMFNYKARTVEEYLDTVVQPLKLVAMDRDATIGYFRERCQRLEAENTQLRKDGEQ